MSRRKIKVLSPAEIARSVWGIRIVGVAFMLGAVLLFVAFAWPRIQLAWRGVQTDAEILDSFTSKSRQHVQEYDSDERLRSRSVEVKSRWLRVRFPVPTGGLAVAEVLADNGGDQQSKGSSVRIIHLPEAPESAELYSGGSFWLHLGVVLAFPLIFFAAGFSVIRLT